jgi:hypothetical protein
MGRLLRSPLPYPLLAAAYPPLLLYAQNLREEVPVGELLSVLAPSVLGAGVVLAAFRVAIGDLDRAARATLVVLVAFFSFGRVEGWLNPGDTRPGVVLPLLACYAALTVAGVVLARRAATPAPRLASGLNLVAAVLVALNVAPIVAHRMGGPRVTAAPERYALPGVDAGTVSERPDVYYIIFDRYAGERTLEELYGFDNGGFLEALERRGFYVAHESLANYPKTTHSLASSLNMDYLDDLAHEVGRDSGDWGPLREAVRGFRVARAFDSLGYTYLHIGSWWGPTSVDPLADVNYTYGDLSEFSTVFLQTTMWPTIAERVGLADPFERVQYERVLYQFDVLERIPRDPRPTFTFAHLTLPHVPYVFDEAGRYVEPEEAARLGRRAAYLQQLEYTNARIVELVDVLIGGPDGADPIVILQSDEGPEPDAIVRDAGFDWTGATDDELGEKLRILNAYHLPGLDDPGLYPTITPVNSFRLVFREYFGADLPPLPDVAWVYQDVGHPYRFTDVTERLRR